MAVAIEVGFEVEVGVARGDLEADAGGAVAIEHEEAVAEDAVDQIGWRGVEDDEVDATAEDALEIVGEGVGLRGQRRRGPAVEEDRDVDVAVGPRRAPTFAAEQVRGHDVVGVVGEVRA